MSGAKSILLFAIVISLVAGAAQGKYSGGTGEPNDPYRIATAEDLNDIGNYEEDWSKNFILVNDVNLAQYTGTQFKIIGNDSFPFTGVFDGNGHRICNFTYEADAADYVGLFGYISDPNAEVKNIELIDPNINALLWVGSLVGYLEHGTIIDCCVDGGTISGLGSVGGLVGENNGSITVSSSSASVSGGGPLGGLVGVNAEGTITNCWSSGSISGSQGIGGLAGASSSAGIISNCYSTATVSGSVVVAGLVGFGHSRITKCYAAGPTYGVSVVGGLVAIGATEQVVDSYWDVNTSGQTTSAGGVGKTTAEMKTSATFTDAGWDFVEIWDIGENQTYPFLRTEPAGDSNHDKKVDLSDLAILSSHWLEDPP